MRGLAQLGVVLLLVGCTGVPATEREQDVEAKAFEAVPGMSVIYLFRDEHLGAGSPISVSLNDQVVGQTAGWTYLRLIVPPGSYRLTSYASNLAEVSIEAEPGELYFIRQDVKPSLGYPRAELRVVDAERGQRGVLASRRVVDFLSAR